ncbi:MAG: hypothetical protein KAS21_00185 [Candidatus Aminicenantes bacterium]|nr:hypothetical protein [Candidatus Aminicenantes bacterium]MCK5003472.1 hypothetical protein [Candidatus Aminicenantes bacterium]
MGSLNRENIVYLTGGEARENASRLKPWKRYKTCVILKVDIKKRTAERIIEHKTPSEACLIEDDPAIMFKSASIKNGRIYVCSQTEVLIYSAKDYKMIKYISLPLFNDLHHVTPTDRGTIMVAVSGLDLVIEITEEGNILNEWSVTGEDTWKRFDRKKDYRMVLTTKPHRSHPNFVFSINGDHWVTRFHQMDAVCLNAQKERIEIGVGFPHDGVKFKDKIYFTTVNGKIAVISEKTGKVERVFDLNEMTDLKNTALGWCRGIKIVSDSVVIVGFGRLRQTKYQENIRWVKYLVRGTRIPRGLPTRIAAYDLKEEKLLWELNLEEYGMHAVFSIL